jgi:hypothetical protein
MSHQRTGAFETAREDHAARAELLEITSGAEAVEELKQ